MSDHSTIEELIAVRSLCGLDAGDLAHLEELMAAHGSGCLECQRLRDQYAEVAGRLAFAVAPEEIPADLEDRIVERAVSPVRARARGRLVAAVAAALILLAGGVGGYLLAPRNAGTVPPIAGALITSMHGSGPGTVTLALRPGSGRSYLVATELADAPPGHLYELWFFHGQTPVRAATFSPTAGVAVIQVPADATDASQAAVTIERAPGVSKPTTHPIFAAPLHGSVKPIRTS